MATPYGRQVYAGDRNSGANVHRWGPDHPGREGDPPIVHRQRDSHYTLALAGRQRMVLNPDAGRLFNDGCG